MDLCHSKSLMEKQFSNAAGNHSRQGGAIQVDVPPHKSQNLQRARTSQMNEESELRIHVHAKNMDRTHRETDGTGLLTLHVCTLGQVMFIPLARSSSIYDQF